MRIDRNSFLDKLKKCKPGVEFTNARLEGSDCFIFKKNRVHSYNGYISVSVPIEYDFECVVSADELLRIITAFKGKDIEIEVKEGSMLLSSGKAKASINLMSETIYKQILAVIPEDIRWKPLPEGFLDALVDCKISNLGMVASMKIDGVFVDSNTAFSTDSVVINVSKLYDSVDKLWLTSKMVNELSKFGKLEFYSLEESWAIFKTDDIVFACRRYIDTSYPIENLKYVIGKMTSDRMRGDVPEGFREIVNNALIMGERKEERTFISMEFQNDGIRVFSGKTTGSYSEFVECPVQNWEHLTISVDGDRLKQALKRHPEAEFHIGYMDGEATAFILHKGAWTEFFMIYKGK